MFQSRFKEYEARSLMVAPPQSTPFWKAQFCDGQPPVIWLS